MQFHILSASYKRCCKECIMLKATPIVKETFPNGRIKWPNVEKAYKFFYPQSNYVETHRAWHDAWHEADILYAMLHNEKLYKR